jgi:hypothetical protein
MENREIVDSIVREVIRRLDDKPAADTADDTSLKRYLIAGPPSMLPEFMRRGVRLCPMETYKGNIAPFDGIYILEMSFAQLADAALCRDNSPLPCAILRALLAGKPVFLHRNALEFGQYQKTAPPMLYARLEGYLKTLWSYGVIPLDDRTPPLPAQGGMPAPAYVSPNTALPAPAEPGYVSPNTAQLTPYAPVYVSPNTAQPTPYAPVYASPNGLYPAAGAYSGAYVPAAKEESSPAAPALDCEEQLITARIADQLVKSGKKRLVFSNKAIITPSAKDSFRAAGISAESVDGRSLASGRRWRA